MAERGVDRESPLVLGAGILLALAAGLAAPRVDPVPALAALALVACAALVIWRFGRLTPSMVLVGVVPLIPAIGVGLSAELLGTRGASVRAALIVASLGALLLIYRGGIPKPAPGLRPVVVGLLALAAAGLFASVANISPTQSLTSLVEHHSGQPLIYAGILVFFAAQVSRSESNKEWLLIAFSIGVWAQAIYVGFEIFSGAAADVSRGFTRGQGTTGSNFVSAYGMMAFFVGLAECRFGSRGRHMRAVGLLTMASSLAVLAGVVARGGILGLLLGFAYLIYTDARTRRRGKVIVATAAAILVGSLFTPVGELWEGRLTTLDTQRFDRPATWVSGIRIGLDNPVSGLGNEPELIKAVQTVPEYAETPFGNTYVIPHNSWILVFSEGGVLSLAVMLALTVVTIGAIHRRRWRSTESRYYVAALLGLAAVAMINNVFRHPELMVIALLLLALVTRPPPTPGET